MNDARTQISGNILGYSSKFLYIWELQKLKSMETDRKWIIVRIDGKIAAISTDYRQLAAISARLAKDPKQKFEEVTAAAVDFEYIWKLRQETSWDDLLLYGTDFQKKVWKKLFDLTHQEASRSADTLSGNEPQPITELRQIPQQRSRLISYSDFAGLCQNRTGVRAVAHAIGLNPIAIIIPCHLVIPKESIDKMKEINRKAESTIFKGDDLCLTSILKEKGIDFGEYALGRRLKRELIQLEFSQPSV